MAECRSIVSLHPKDIADVVEIGGHSEVIPKLLIDRKRCHKIPKRLVVIACFKG